MSWREKLKKSVAKVVYKVDRSSQRQRIAGFVVVFALISSAILLVSHAASPNASLESENGAVTCPASVGSDSNASGGSYVQFKTSCVSSTWKPLKQGAGGFIRGIDMSADGQTKVVRADTYGAYILNGNQWDELVNSNSMPTADVVPNSDFGAYDIKVAPHNDNKLYMAWHGSVYLSTDRGSHWSKTALTGKSTISIDIYAQKPDKLAIDPANDSVVYMGVPGDGVYVTSDSGSNWTKLAAIPGSVAAPGYTGIVFDPSGGTTGGKTKVIYIHVEGTGYYKSTDAGTTWALLSGSPTGLTGVVVASDGTLYTTSSSTFYRYNGTTWAVLQSGSNGLLDIEAIALDPTNTQHMVLISGSGYIQQSYNGGTSWQSIVGSPGVGTVTLSGTNDVPWLTTTGTNYMTTGQMMFAPDGTFWYTSGVGVWTANLSDGMKSITWNSHSQGIEELVVNKVLSSPNGSLNVVNWDFGEFHITNPDVYPSTRTVSGVFEAAWDIDYSLSDPNFLVSNFSDSLGTHLLDAGYSTDGGSTWTPFASMPAGATKPGTYGYGAIAVGDTNHIVWVGSGKWPYYTANRGATWQPVTMQGLSQSSFSTAGFFSAYYLARHNVAADRVNTNTFYMLYSTNGNVGGGIYKSTDGGANWTRAYAAPQDYSDPASGTPMGSAILASGWNSEIQAEPGKTGDLFFTTGSSGNLSLTSSNTSFLHSTDGGSTWNAVPNVKEVFAFGYGKAMPGSNNPTIFIVGWVNSQYGVWRSADEGQTWTNLGTWPYNVIDSVTTVSGDMSIAGRVYVGTRGTGAYYRDSQ